MSNGTHFTRLNSLIIFLVLSRVWTGSGYLLASQSPSDCCVADCGCQILWHYDSLNVTQHTTSWDGTSLTKSTQEIIVHMRLAFRINPGWVRVRLMWVASWKSSNWRETLPYLKRRKILYTYNKYNARDSCEPYDCHSSAQINNTFL